jgi:uncharacterized membrane protein
MRNYLPQSLFVLLEIMVVTYIISSAALLPATVASHFNGSGAANGFMSQKGHTVFMLVFAVGIPLLVVGSLSITLHLAADRINIPNREYWLLPQNKPATVRFLQGHVAYLGMIISSFVAYIQWLLIKANSVRPPQLSNSLFLAGMGTFLAVMLMWGIWLVVRFSRVPKA